MRIANKKTQARSFLPERQTAFFLLLGLGVLWFAKSVADIRDGPVLITLVVVPALLYLVLSDKIKELTGPGGISARFVNYAARRVSAIGEKIEADAVIPIEKLTLPDLDVQARMLGRNDPVLLTLKLGTAGYTTSAVRQYIETLSLFPRFRLVAFLDSSGRFVGCTSPGDLDALMRNTALGDAFLSAVIRGDEREVFRYPSIQKKHISADDTNAEALEKMTVNNFQAMAVVDENCALKGVVERDELVSKLVLSLTRAVSRDGG